MIARTGVSGQTIAGVAHHQFVVAVTVEGGSGVAQNFLVSVLSTVGGGQDIVNGSRQADGVFDSIIIETVVARGVDLVVHAPGPVVTGHVAVFGVDIAVDIVFPPNVKGRGIVGIALNI